MMKQMDWHRCVLTSILFVGLFAHDAIGIPPADAPTQVPLRELPKRLVAVVQKAYPKGEIIRAEKAPYTPAMMDTESWALKVLDGKQELQVGVVSISGDYQVNSIAQTVAIADLPRSVTEALRAKYPGAKIQSASKVQNGLIGWRSNDPKPADYQLIVVPSGSEPLDLFLTPELKMNSKGGYEPNSEKMRIDRESPATSQK
jgi:hypothetical protein